MKNNLPFVFLCLLLSSCIDQIDFDTNTEERVIVIDGLFTDLEETQLIKVSESIALNNQIPVPVFGAEIYVEDEDGNRIPFTQQDNGDYTAEAKAERDQQYRLFGILPDGREITSNFQAVPSSLLLDTINLVDTTVIFTDESGDRRRIKSLDFYATAAAPFVEKDLYLRFSHETAYQISEIVCSPFVPAKTCYFLNDIRPLNINLLTINETESPVQFNTFVYRRAIDFSVGEVFALDLRLYSYNKDEYEYWQKLKLIFDQEGNITDSAPARLTGNISTNDGSEVLGQFAVVGKSRKIRFVRNSDFATQQSPYCGLPGLRPYPLPEACCGCQVLPDAQLEKPDYWP